MHSGTVLFAALLISLTPALSEGISPALNEVMVRNTSTLADEDGCFPDWIELHNPHFEAVSLAGFGLSDDADSAFKWIFPDTILPGASFLIVFASDKDRATAGCELHTNFRIAAGEELVLSEPYGARHDSIMLVEMTSDVSYGRVPDGNGAWWLFEEPTPGTSNGLDPPPARTSPPEFMPRSGFYEPDMQVLISCADSGAIIHYTTDGSTPTDTSSVYSGPVSLTQATVIRANARMVGLLPSLPVSQSYVIDFETQLPVISIIAEPTDLWSDESGIYTDGPNADPEPPHWGANYWEDWEIPVDVDFFEPNQRLGFSQRLGMKIHGGWSRALPQKSLRLTARGEYGTDCIEYPLFPSEAIFSYESVILRNSGNDWHYTMMRDALMTGLARGSAIGIQAYRPVVVFLNGAYWGMYNLRERIDEHYLSAHYGVAPDSVDLIENSASASCGDRIAYDRLLSLVENTDLSQSGMFDSVQSMMDVENFAKYMLHEIYFDNFDWPWNNIRRWRPRRPNGRFQWLLYDTDMAFGLFQSDYQNNTLARILDQANDPWEGARGAPVILRALLENDDFRSAFLIRFCDLTNHFVNAEGVLQRIECMQETIASEMIRHQTRWYPGLDWDEKVETLRAFAYNRRQYMVTHLGQEFGVTHEVRLTIERSTPVGGRVFVNSFEIDDYPWQGQYFTGLPVELCAEPFQGYKFLGWEGAVTATSEDVVLFVPNDDTTVRARFAPADRAQSAVAITEINYHGPSFSDPGDWIELSLAEGALELSGWIIRDEDDTHEYVIPENTTIAAGRCLIAAADPGAFEAVFPGVEHLSGELGFALSNSSDQVRLYTRDGAMVDSMQYDDRAPWPVQADGNGATLQLIDIRYPNEIARNWQASRTFLGDPGVSHTDSGGGADRPDEIPSVTCVGMVSPNPFRTEASLALTLREPSRLCVKAYDSAGRLVSVLEDGYRTAGTHSIRLESSGLASGSYFVRVCVDGTKEHVYPIIVLR